VAEPKRKPVVVIVGMGDTGVLTAVNLPRSYDIVAVSTKTSLVSGQELGARIADPERWKRDFLTSFARFRRLDGVAIVHGKVSRTDFARREVVIAGADGGERAQPYDVLVIAAGVTNGFWRDDRFADDGVTEEALAADHAKLAAARTIAIVGGGPSGASAAANLAERFPEKAVHFFYSALLPGYRSEARGAIEAKLKARKVALHPEHRAFLPEQERRHRLDSGRIEWASGQAPFEADAILWTTGAIRPNTSFLPPGMLDQHGFVLVDDFLRVRGQENVFAIGDVAATDPNRSSARNWGAPLLAKNIQALLEGRPAAMVPFKAPPVRWGSIIGLEQDGLRVFQADGKTARFPRWSVNTLLFPVIVKGTIYRGVRPPKTSRVVRK
jgi:NADH dehydrogenase FAD-containing subunit